MAAEAIVESLCTKLRSAIADDAMVRLNYTSALQEMLDDMEAIQEVLADVDRRTWIWDPPPSGPRRPVLPADLRRPWNLKSQQEWVAKVRDAAYGVSDMVDELQPTKIPASGKMTQMLHRPANLPKNKLSDKMKKMKEMKETLRGLHRESPAYDSRDTRALLEAPGIVGRDADRERIIDQLTAWDISAGPIILLICGERGVGKTTMAAMLFDDPRFKYYSRVWVDVLKAHQLHEIGNSIISQLSGEELAESYNKFQIGSIRERLSELFNKGNKALIVLDDLWCTFGQWEPLKQMLSVGSKDSQVTVIATVNLCAEQAALKFFGVRPYHLHLLGWDMCYKIIWQTCRSYEISSKEDLMRIAPQIASLSWGIPLAAQLFGSMLQFRNYREWPELLDINLWTGYPPLLLSLELSYRSMPPDLRLCFAYCGIFQSGHSISKDDLIYQWIALGLIEAPDLFSMSRRAEEYIERLLEMSLIQTTKLSWTSGKDDKGAIFLHIHTEVHSFASRALGVDYGCLDGATSRSFSGIKHCRYALVCNLGTRLLSSILSHQKIRALRCYGCSKMVLNDESFLFASCLRVLELKESSMQKLSDSICKLEHLGYLNLSGCSRLVTLPDSFGNLTNLLHVDLSSCSTLANLPVSFGKLTKLMHINLSGCSELEELPESFGKLTNVMHINISKCSLLEKLPQSFGKLISLVHINLSGCYGLLKLPEFFGRLINLVHINLSDCPGLENLPGSFGKLTNLVHISLSGCSGLEKLPESFGKLINLEHINLSGCCGLVSLPESFGDLTNLLHIDMSHCYGLSKLPESFGNLKKLVYLDLSFWSCFEGIQKALGCLTNLEYLNLSHPCCYHAEYSHPEELKRVLCHLTKLQHLNLSMFLNPIFYNQSEDKNNAYIASMSGLCKLKHLDLSHNIFLSDLPESLGALDRLHTLDLSGCIRLKKVKEWMTKVKSLKSIVLKNCEGLESYQYVVGAYDNLNNYVQVEDISSKDLKISCLEKMNSLVEARRIRLVKKQKLQTLKLCWTITTKLQPPGSGNLQQPGSRNMEQGDSGNLPQPRIGNMQQPGSGNMQQPGAGNLPQPGIGNIQQPGSGNIQQVGSEILAQPGFGNLPQPVSGNLQQPGSGNLRQPGFGNIQRPNMQQPGFGNIQPTGYGNLPQPRPGNGLGNMQQPGFGILPQPLFGNIQQRAFGSIQWPGYGYFLQPGPGNMQPWLGNMQRPGSENLPQQGRQPDFGKNPPPGPGKLPVCSSVGENDLLGELEPPHNLQCLELYGYRGELCHPSWWTQDICSGLLSLATVTMEDFPRCSRLPPFGLLPNLKQLTLRRMASISRIDAGELSGGSITAFHGLTKFTIDDLPSLKEFNTTYSSGSEELMFPDIVEFVIQKCPELSFVPIPPKARRLVISECNLVMVCWRNRGDHGVEEPISSSASVNKLTIEGCVAHLSHWTLLHKLADLRSLTIQNCYNLTSSPEIILSLSSLEKLYFSKCHSMTELPEHLGDLTALQKLNIISCGKLNSFPDSMQHLTSLQSINLCDCQSFQNLPEWLGELSSLEKLVINSCCVIDSFPTSISKLTNLKDLNISNCQNLKKWIEVDGNEKILGPIKLKYEDNGSMEGSSERSSQGSSEDSRESSSEEDDESSDYDDSDMSDWELSD